MPSTRIASISSRILRAPRSAQMADPPAPATTSAVTIGPDSRTTASTDAAPVNDCAPSWRTSDPSCRAITAPNGMETSAAGRIDTELMNQACWISSRIWNGRRHTARAVSPQNATKEPAEVRVAVTGFLMPAPAAGATARWGCRRSRR
jgi:hypothetical protein